MNVVKKVNASEAATLPRIVLVDANVFFSPRMRDLVMHLHAEELINVHWTKEIEAEWTRNVVAKQGADAEDIQACLRGMRDAVDGWEVTGYNKHKAKFEPVDPKDHHVAAAAYKLSLDDGPGQDLALVTKNVKDFPQRVFEGTHVTLYSLSGYIDALYAAESDRVANVTEGCRSTGLARGLSELWSVECPKVAKDGTLFYESDVPTKKPAMKKVERKR